MKKIGIILRNDMDENNDYLAIKQELLTFLRKYRVGVVGILLDFQNEVEEEFLRVEKILNSCDGIIFPGGDNYYDIDLKIMRYLYTQNKPVLGICLGMQIMNMAFGGDMDYIEHHKSEEKYVHEVKINQNSKLYSILKESTILVNSRHKEYVTTTDLSISAISPDLVIEATEDKNKTFFIGIQWHPESIVEDVYSNRLFEYFISVL